MDLDSIPEICRNCFYSDGSDCYYFDICGDISKHLPPCQVSDSDTCVDDLSD